MINSPDSDFLSAGQSTIKSVKNSIDVRKLAASFLIASLAIISLTALMTSESSGSAEIEGRNGKFGSYSFLQIFIGDRFYTQ